MQITRAHIVISTGINKNPESAVCSTNNKPKVNFKLVLAMFQKIPSDLKMVDFPRFKRSIYPLIALPCKW